MTVLGDAEPGNQQPASAAAQTAPEGPGVDFFRTAWSTFADAQTEAIINIIKDESLVVDDVLRIAEGMPSLKSM